MVAKGQQLLWQILIHGLVSKQSTSLVSGDQIGRWRLKDKSEIRSTKQIQMTKIQNPKQLDGFDIGVSDLSDFRFWFDGARDFGFSCRRFSLSVRERCLTF